MVEALAGNAAILLGCALILWAYALHKREVSFAGAWWGAGMVLAALASWVRVIEPAGLATLLLAMTAIWGARLAIHLFRRWRREGEDPRYRCLMPNDRENGRFGLPALFKIFVGQTVLLFLVSSPAQLGILQASSIEPISGLAMLGLVIWLIGIGFEWVGDWQLARFRADPANEGRVLDTGLWRYTRHPNYFGDMLAWWGIWIAAASAGWWVAALTLIGPLLLTFTLTRWSGVPMLERHIGGRRADYENYVRRTSAFVPLPPRKKRRKLRR